METKKFGKISLKIKAGEGNHFVPPKTNYLDNRKILETLAYSIQENLPTLIIGETGTGKTSAIRYLAHETNNGFRRLNLNGATTVDELVGKILIKDGSTYWTDGVLVDAMRHGHWLLIDEINAGLPEVLFVLQSLLDDDGYIVLSDKEDKEIVRPHKDFRLFATMNPSEGYSGTKELNKALMSRFNLVLTMDFLPLAQELKVMTQKLDLREDEELKMAEAMIKFANALRASYKSSQLDFVMSTREVYYWIRMTKYSGDVLEGARLSFMSKASNEDKEVIEDLLKVHFKTCQRLLEESDFSVIKPDVKQLKCYSLNAIVLEHTSKSAFPFIIAPKSTVIVTIKNNEVDLQVVIANDIQVKKLEEAYTSDVNILRSGSRLSAIPVTKELKEALALNMGLMI